MTAAAPLNTADLSPEQARELSALWSRWQSALLERNYPAADLLRDELAEWGTAGNAMMLWHPVYVEPVGRASA